MGVRGACEPPRGVQRGVRPPPGGVAGRANCTRACKPHPWGVRRTLVCGMPACECPLPPQNTPPRFPRSTQGHGTPGPGVVSSPGPRTRARGARGSRSLTPLPFPPSARSSPGPPEEEPAVEGESGRARSGGRATHGGRVCEAWGERACKAQGHARSWRVLHRAGVRWGVGVVHGSAVVQGGCAKIGACEAQDLGARAGARAKLEGWRVPCAQRGGFARGPGGGGASCKGRCSCKARACKGRCPCKARRSCEGRSPPALRARAPAAASPAAPGHAPSGRSA